MKHKTKHKARAALLLAALLVWLSCAPALAATPETAGAQPQNLIENPGFEQGLQGWEVLGDCAMDEGYSGDHGLLIPSQYGVVLRQTITLPEAGDYVLGAYMKNIDVENPLGGLAPIFIKGAFGRFSMGMDPKPDWSAMEATFTVPEEYANTTVSLELESPGFLIDDLSLVPARGLPQPPQPDPSDNLVPNPGFEQGIEGWTSIAGTSGLSAGDAAHQGSASLCLTSPKDQACDAMSPVLPAVQEGEYEVSAYVLIPEQETAATCSVLFTDQELSAGAGVGLTIPKSGTWQRVTFRSSFKETERPVLWITNDFGGVVYVDDLSVTPVSRSQSLLQNGGFEEGLQGWTQRGQPNALVTDSMAYSGTQSLYLGYFASEGMVNYVEQTVPATKGTYTASAMIHTVEGFSGVGAVLLLELRDQNGRLLTTLSSAAMSSSGGGWEELSYPFAAPSGTASITLKLGGIYCTGAFYADNVRLESA